MEEVRLDEESRGLLQKLSDLVTGQAPPKKGDEDGEGIAKLAEEVKALRTEVESRDEKIEELEKKVTEARGETAAERAARRLREYTDLVKRDMPNIPVEASKMAETMEWLNRVDHTEDKEGNVTREHYDLVTAAFKALSELAGSHPNFKQLADEKATGQEPQTIEEAKKRLLEVAENKELSGDALLILAVETWPELGMTEAEIAEGK